MIRTLPLICLCTLGLFPGRTSAQPPDQEKQKPIVVLTFDDSVKSHFTVARPILKEYGFGATFFITEGFSFKSNKEAYMTWEEIKQLHDDGFEIGNHTRDHMSVTDKSFQKLDEQLTGIEERCKEYKIPKPTSFAWPGNEITAKAFPILKKHGIVFARRGTQPEYGYVAGQGPVYEPGFDHPLLIPTTGDARPDWKFDNFAEAVSKWEPGKFVVLQFHGVPDLEHIWVHTPRENFEVYMRFLKSEGCQVIAMRDLSKYVDPKNVPRDPWHAINTREEEMKAAAKAKENANP